ncbi:Card1-like endonuclease domain-containing protein [Clostridium sp. ZS2-4]|uniref:Card1-like endonuclease domain-containing protein n=1 Tax=Clostridium sp. ZS2-4 TaxID=2987703 RepID=UPI00227D3860|nr:DUF1887 family CARF protein [Clostridium sp. ZS2-4]MCY6354924.1 DUF1887 family CARF protein [Clostridium sp. ZS2-4]
MKCKNLINLLEDFNEQNAVAALNLKPEKVIFVYENNREDFEEFEIIKSYLKDKLTGIEIEGIPIDEVKSKYIEPIIIKYSGEDTVINLAGGSRLMSLIAYRAAEKHKITSIFVDVEHESILNFTDNSIHRLNIEFRRLGVKDFIESTGGKILLQSTKLFNKANVQEFVDYIIKNYEPWNDFKMTIIHSNIAQNNDSLMNRAIISLKGINNEDKKEHYKFLTKFKELDLIDFSYKDEDQVVIYFNNSEIKTLFLKTGTWLEVLVYKVVKGIKEVDDVKSGVLFLWDNDVRNVKNEIDVLAAAKSQLVYISCKDTSKYDDGTLNELQVYAEQLGGVDVKKVLVATKPSHKRSTFSRAEEMGIHIVIFDGDVEKLENKLQSIIVS